MEKNSNGGINYPDVHENFHCPSSLSCRTKYILANFTNEHAACYVLRLGAAFMASGAMIMGVACCLPIRIIVTREGHRTLQGFSWLAFPSVPALRSTGSAAG